MLHYIFLQTVVLLSLSSPTTTIILYMDGHASPRGKMPPVKKKGQTAASYSSIPNSFSRLEVDNQATPIQHS